MVEVGAITVGLVVGVIFTTLWYFRNIFKYKMPPGPWGLPVVGYLPFLGAQPQETYMRLREKYGDVYSVQLGSFQSVIVNGRGPIKDVLLNSTGMFDTRPDFYSFCLWKGRFAFGDYSEKWIVLKKIVINKLAIFINDKDSPIDSLLQEEASMFVSDIGKHNGQPFDPKMDLYVTSGSVIYQLLYGRGEDIRNDTDFRELLTTEKGFIDHATSRNPAEVMPWLSKVFYSLVKPIHDLTDYFIYIRKKKEVEHRKHFEKNNIRDLTDAFLDVEGKETPEMKSVGLVVEDLLLALEEIFPAAFDTTATTMRWILLFLVQFPSVQKQLHEEVEREIGNRTPSLEEKNKLSYTEAVILESMRFKTPIPLAVPHCAFKNASIGGYVMPKGTPVIINLHSLAGDTDIWEHPNAFYPEHFLTADGKIDREKSAQISPFGLGKRKCVGEVLARNNLFLWLVNVVQKFEILPVEGEEYNMVGVNGITDCPKPYKIIAKAR